MLMQINKVALLMACGALVVALGSQYLLGAKPCDLCVLQRYPYVVVMVLSALALLLRKPTYAFNTLIMLAFFSTAAIAAYHVGVEQGWVNAPESCATNKAAATSLEDLKVAILSTKAVSCKDVGASFAGISMAAWNMIYGLSSAFIIGYLWKKQARQSPK